MSSKAVTDKSERKPEFQLALKKAMGEKVYWRNPLTSLHEERATLEHVVNALLAAGMGGDIKAIRLIFDALNEEAKAEIGRAVANGNPTQINITNYSGAIQECDLIEG